MSHSHAIPDADFAHRFQVSRGTPESFFEPTPAHEVLIAERRKWIGENPHRYTGFQPEAAALVEEAIELLQGWGGCANNPITAETGFERCVALGCQCEPDFLLLGREHGTSPRLLAGSVCFPSGWSLEEKIGQPLTAIHSVVPQLNETIGAVIETFLGRLKPDTAWNRANWGLSGSPELNQHPCRGIPALLAPLTLDRIWLRVEDQTLVALPKTNGILFGIRVSSTSLEVLVETEPEAAHRLLRALRTIPDEMAAYKRIVSVRETIAEVLSSRLDSSVRSPTALDRNHG